LALERKRREIARSEERIGFYKGELEAIPYMEERVRFYQDRLMEILPFSTRMIYLSMLAEYRPKIRLKGLYEYYYHYWRVRKADWQTRYFLEELRDEIKAYIKREIRAGREIPTSRQEEILRRLEAIDKEIDELKKGLTETEKIAVEREWRVRRRIYPGYSTFERWIKATYGRQTPIHYWQDEIKRELIILVRVKIRIYNEERLPTPTGMFQGWFDIDALLSPATNIPRWDWWLTKEEINIARYHFVGYFKGMAKWRTPAEVDLAYFAEPTGIPYPESKATYKRGRAGLPYAKNVPDAIIRRAETLTIEELIIGESSVEPKPNKEPSRENMGVFSQRFMIIDADGVIKWDEIRNRWIWHPTDDMVNRVKKELGIK